MLIKVPGEYPSCNTCSKHNHHCDGYVEKSADGFSEQVAPDEDCQSITAGGAISGSGYEDSPEAPGIGPEGPGLNVPTFHGPRSSNSRFDTSSTAWLPGGPAKYASKHDEQNHIGDPLLARFPPYRMPYFRYFGPTAIMPGFKQMVVKVKERMHNSSASRRGGMYRITSRLHSETQYSCLADVYPIQSTIASDMIPTSQPKLDPFAAVGLPKYASSHADLDPLIDHLCRLFFARLGSTFPFLQEDRFMRDLHEKQVDPILVDAVCAVTARFSTHASLVAIAHAESEGERIVDPASIVGEAAPSQYGEAFARRAKSAIVDTFACPTVAIVQAALLLAHTEFGAARDSGLWMFLGISIRMVQDLGLQKLAGLRFEGRKGSSLSGVVSSRNDDKQARTLEDEADHQDTGDMDDVVGVQEQRAIERERVDTFWATFFLDRTISSGTGRPVTLGPEDIELSLPPINATDPKTGAPPPFPALIHIIDLYGTFTDLLNGIRDVSHVTPETLSRLRDVESHLTQLYQDLSLQLHFNAVNFKRYVGAGQGPCFVLLHLWFHALIVVLHQPTLLRADRVYELLPNNRELSMSSAKTIADIIAFAELIDVMAVISHHNARSLLPTTHPKTT